ncbi:hypothetical protein [uncultured Salinicola sp.]|uniref:hypothetical protein n=1 Tax=uncultured Salinicola sp. TaxID=1193542 RepID=UPI002639AB1F|nr:hypothetical protein [uncultured Salinicola sp.]|tara:strand:+ start:15763 stop:16206 length:444 start_codon:yes stop_codon:yes gene_type:complete
MNEGETDIGREFQQGERLPLPAAEVVLLIDSPGDHEILLIARGQDRSDLVHAGPQEPYSIDRYENGQKVTIRTNLMDSGVRYTLGAYTSNSVMPNILATIDDPRGHLPLPSRGEGAVAIAEFYNKGDWRLKVDGGWYREGLKAMLSA